MASSVSTWLVACSPGIHVDCNLSGHTRPPIKRFSVGCRSRTFPFQSVPGFAPHSVANSGEEATL